MGFINNKPSLVTFYNREGSVLIEEITLIAVLAETNGVLAVGKEVIEAKSKMESVDGVLLGSPLKNGLVIDFDLTRMIFRYFFLKAKLTKFFNFLRSSVAVCIPVDLTWKEQAALKKLLHNAGAKKGELLIVKSSYEEAVNRRSISDKYKIIIEILPDAEAP